MEFDWTNSAIGQNGDLTRQEVEESFEDPYGIRFFPDSARFAQESRTFCLGKTVAGVGIFHCVPVGWKATACGRRPQDDD